MRAEHQYRVRAWADVADSYGATTEESTTITAEQYDYNCARPPAARRARRRRRRRAAARRRRGALGARAPPAVEARGHGWTLTGYMRNKSGRPRLDRGLELDPDTCVQALSAIMTVINSNNATDGSDEAIERVQLRAYVLATHYPSCVAMMNLTTTTATQRAGVLSTTTAESAEFGPRRPARGARHAKGLAVEADDAGEGIASDTASALGNALSAVLDVVRSVLGPSTATDVRAGRRVRADQGGIPEDSRTAAGARCSARA